MLLSKSTKIWILLGVDVLFFLLELIVGSTVNSLALVADSFHMLNDVISLCVGLWAVRVASRTTSSKTYTYGWQRAETLGALVNGVFLVALCFTIFIEAIQRLFDQQEVLQPKLVFIVGSCGLVSNILGLLLFHDHGHGHGHQHGSAKPENATLAAEEGRGFPSSSDEQSGTFNGPGNSEDGAEHLTRRENAASDQNFSPKSVSKFPDFTRADQETLTVEGTTSNLSHPDSNVTSGSQRRHRSHRSSSRGGMASSHPDYTHPVEARQRIIDAGNLEQFAESENTTESESEMNPRGSDSTAQETDPLIPKDQKRFDAGSDSARHDRKPSDLAHSSHKHRQPKSPAKGGHGHSHGDLNMRGVFLHVLGDALGNIGVMGSALFVGLTSFSWRHYSDPVISIMITAIILTTAIPLCLAASRILLQAVPAHISVDDVKDDIEKLPGVVSCHHLHVWQLNDIKLVASLHVQIAFDFKGAGAKEYMKLAKAIRTCLHEYGIHASTIQPEFCLDSRHDHSKVSSPTEATGADSRGQSAPSGPTRDNMSSKRGSTTASLHSVPDACLLDCDDACAGGNCCTTGTGERNGDTELRD